MSETVETVPEPLGGGALLRQAREKAGVHIAALAVALKVPVRQLEALEQGRLEALPDHTFARALAGSVCRHLKVDPAPILAALPPGAARVVTVNGGINAPFHASPGPGASWRDRLMRPPVLAAVGLLLAALALIIVPELQGDEAAVAPAVNPQAPVPAAATEPADPAAAAAPAASRNVVVEPVTPLRPAPSPPLAPVAPAASAAPRQP